MNYSLLLSMGVGIFLASCSTTNQEKQQESYQVISPIIADTVITSEYVAEINALQNVELRSRMRGMMEEILVDEGQEVQQGQTLFRISSKEVRQALQKAKAILKSAVSELKSSEIELENSRKLFEKQIIGRSEYELASSKVDAMKAKVEEAESDKAQAELQLSFAEVKAPFDGIINRIPKKMGSLIEEGTLLTTISNSKEVYAYFHVSEKEYLDYVAKNGDNKSKKVSLMLANGTPYLHLGEIETVESEFDESTGNIAFRAKFPNPELLLKHGASGKVLVTKKLKNAMLIPQKSTFEVQEYVYLFTVDSQNIVHQQRIIPIARLPHYYAIQSGISAGSKILFEGIQKVKDGDKVKTEPLSNLSLNETKIGRR